MLQAVCRTYHHVNEGADMRFARMQRAVRRDWIFMKHCVDLANHLRILFKHVLTRGGGGGDGGGGGRGDGGGDGDGGVANPGHLVRLFQVLFVLFYKFA